MKHPSPTERARLLDKTRSLLGVFPLGVFVVLHFWEHASATGGQQAYDERIALVEPITGVWVFRALGIYVPLALHAVLGLGATFRRATRGGDASPDWTLAERVHHATGLVTLLFVGYHVWHLRFRTASRPMLPEDYFFELAGALSSTTEAGIPAVASAYLIGAAAVSYHLAYGLTAFCVSWNLTTSTRAQQLARRGFAVLGVLLFLTSVRTLLYFATGS